MKIDNVQFTTWDSGGEKNKSNEDGCQPHHLRLN